MSPRQYRNDQLALEAEHNLDKAEVELASLRARQPVERPLVVTAIDLRLELALALLRQVTATVASKALEKRLGMLRERLDAVGGEARMELARAVIKFDAAGPKLRLVKDWKN